MELYDFNKVAEDGAQKVVEQIDTTTLRVDATLAKTSNFREGDLVITATQPARKTVEDEIRIAVSERELFLADPRWRLVDPARDASIEDVRRPSNDCQEDDDSQRVWTDEPKRENGCCDQAA